MRQAESLEGMVSARSNFEDSTTKSESERVGHPKAEADEQLL
jgi:hypothetical protein